LKKKKVLSFFGVFVSGCVFHLISVFLGPEHRWCEDPIGIGPFIIIPSYASVLLFSAQDNSRYTVCYLQHTQSWSLSWMTFWGLFTSIYIGLLNFIPQIQLIMSEFHKKLSADQNTQSQNI